MNRIIRDSLDANPIVDFASLGMEAYIEEMDHRLQGLKMALTRLNGLDTIKNKLIEAGGINRSIAMEGFQFVPTIISKEQPLGSYTVDISDKNYQLALEAVEGARKSVLERIKEMLKRIYAFAMDLFNRIKNYIGHFFTSEEENKRSLANTQAMLNAAKKKQNGEAIATEGYATGTIPVVAPRYLHIDYPKIITETAKLELLAQSFIKDTIALLGLQFRQCKLIIEAYHRLMKSENPNLSDFDNAARFAVEDSEHRMQQFHSEHKAFDCIEILEEIKSSEFAGVLKYRASIKPPSKEDMEVAQTRITTNLFKAQDLQDHLVKLNEKIVFYAKDIQTFYAAHAKTFLNTVNELNDSAIKSPEGKFDAHSEYIMQVHSFLVRGNLIQVVLGLNVLNNVWKSVHGLNTRVVKEFLNS